MRTKNNELDKCNIGQSYPLFAARCFSGGYSLGFLAQLITDFRDNNFLGGFRMGSRSALREAFHGQHLSGLSIALFSASVIPPLAAILFQNKFEKTTANNPLLAIPALFVGAGMGIGYITFANRFLSHDVTRVYHGSYGIAGIFYLYTCAFGTAGVVLPVGSAIYQHKSSPVFYMPVTETPLPTIKDAVLFNGTKPKA